MTFTADDHAQLTADLTSDQRAAVEHAEGPLLVLAGPGSGKTRVITRRVALLMSRGVPAWNILALTFTNKAAGEMKRRVEALIAADAPGRRGLTVTTFHAFCAMFLRRNALECGVDPEFVIYDADDQRAAMKSAVAEAGLDSKNFSPGQVHARVSAAKNALITAEDFATNAGDFVSRQVAKAYSAYERLLSRMHALDFDDLLLRTATALRDNQALRVAAGERYRHLLIDEYQDTNRAQFVIAQMIAGEHRNICVVGDPDQSIYRWRGADIRNILEFEAAFPGAAVIPLGENFRSTAHIVRAADGLIRHNKRRRSKPAYTALGDRHRVRVVRVNDEHSEAELVAGVLQEVSTAGTPWRECAVLYRMNALSRTMEDALRKRSIPYRIVRGTAFYDRKEVKDLLAYLRLVANPADDLACVRIVNTPVRGIGATSVARAGQAAAERGIPLLAAMAHAQDAGVAERTARKMHDFGALIARWRQMIDTHAAASLAAFVDVVLTESGLREAADDNAEEDAEDRRANLDEVVTAAGEFTPAETEETPSIHVPLRQALNGFLQSAALVADTDALDPDAGAVTLMTLHAAKGLEYEQVCIIGCEEGLLPHARSRADDEELEEERRLLFVGMTRAKQSLLLTAAASRTARGLRMGAMESSFLRELPEAETVREDLSYGRGSLDMDEDPERNYASPGSAGRFPVGTEVRHPMFGLGTVQAVMPRGSVTSVRVSFRAVGVKTLVLEYARLERVGP